MSDTPPVVVNIADVAEVTYGSGPWGGASKPLTPLLDARKGALGMNISRLSKGQTGCPFHAHLREDEIFYVLSGRGVLRYGETLYDIGPGDAISCPAGTMVAHQLANPYDEDLVYLAIGPNDPHEVCVYPDNGKVLVRGVRTVGFLQKADYMAGEPEQPRIFELIAERAKAL